VILKPKGSKRHTKNQPYPTYIWAEFIPKYKILTPFFMRTTLSLDRAYILVKKLEKK